MRGMNYEDLGGKSILVLGKTRAVSTDEFDTLLKLNKIERLGSYKEGVALIIEGRMMNPYEEAESVRLYELGIAPIIELSHFEEWLCKSIEPNRLLMSLKLSRNQERLVNFLKNPYITDELFFKLLKLYDWQNEGLFDNDANRDVTASIIGRFYTDLDRNHNVQYAMSGLAHLIERYGTEALIAAISELAPIARELKTPSDRSYAGVLDAMALHSDTTDGILSLLIGERAKLLAYREPLGLEKELLALNREEINTILSQNTTLSEDGAALLEHTYPQLIASNTRLSEERFDRLIKKYPHALAANATLTPKMQQWLYALGDETVFESLAANPITENTILEKLFETGRFRVQLAMNPSLAPQKLEMLFLSQDTDVLLALAANLSTPIALLYQLSLDQRFERSVKTNPAFGKHIQTYNIGWN